MSDTRTIRFLYRAPSDGRFVFVDTMTFGQVDLDLPEVQGRWLTHGMDVQATDKGIALPDEVVVIVAEVNPSGSSLTGLWGGTTESGVKIRIPSFVQVGDAVRMSPHTGEYLGKACPTPAQSDY